MRFRRSMLLVLLAAAFALPAPPVRAHTVPIAVNHTNLSPAEAANYVSHPIVWHNASPVPRSIAADLGVFESGLMLLNDEFTWNSTVAGTFSYRADLLGLGLAELAGRVTVRPLLTGQRSRGVFAERYQWGVPGHVPAGFVFEVQRGVFGRKDGKRVDRWMWLFRGTRATSGWLAIPCDGLGRTLRVRVRDAAGNRSGWAPLDQVAICIP